MVVGVLFYVNRYYYSKLKYSSHITTEQDSGVYT